MLNSMKYSIIRAFRDKEFMLSGIIMVVLMGTIMYFMTDSMFEEFNEGTLEIPVAVVEIAGSEESLFIEILETAEMFELKFVSMEEALYQLEANDVAGIFEVGNELRLLVKTSNFRQMLLQSLADEYIRSGNMLTSIASENPQNLQNAIMSMIERQSVMSEMLIAEELVDIMQFSIMLLIATIAISGIFVGFERAIMTNNDGAIASRRITSSFSKMKILLADLMGVTSLVVVMTGSIWAYFSFVLGINLKMNVGLATLAFFLSSLFSVSFGAFVGLFVPGNKKMREQALFGAYMGMIMLAFFGINARVEIIDSINQVNPMIRLANSLIALNMGNYARYFGFIGTMSFATIVFLVLAIIASRRNRHVDIR